MVPDLAPPPRPVRQAPEQTPRACLRILPRLLGLPLSVALGSAAHAADHYLSAGTETISSTVAYDNLVVANTSDPASLTISAGTVSASTVVVGSDATSDAGLAGGNDGLLTINSGARLQDAGDATLSYASNTKGTVTLQPGGTFTVGGRLNVGRSALGLLNSAGTLQSTDAMIGDLTDSGGSQAAITGGSWTNSHAFVIGGEGAGTLALSGGGHLVNTSDVLVLGNSTTGTGTLTTTGANSLTAGEIRIGNFGQGTFQPTTATLSSADAFLGFDSSSAGNTATLDNSTWTVTGNFNIGYGGAGSAQLQNTSTLTATGDTVLGNSGGAQGSLSLSAGSTFSTTGLLLIGSGGQGTLTADGSGTQITAAGATLGNQSTSTGNTATLTNGARLDLGTGVIYIGNAGAGSLSLASGAALKASNAYIGWDTGSAGTLTLDAGAAPLEVSNIYFNNGTGSVVFNHGLATYTYGGHVEGAGAVSISSGTTTFTGSTIYTGPTTVASGATLKIGTGGTAGELHSDVANSGTLIFNRSDALVYGAAISGNGSLVKQGAGTLGLTANSIAFSGGTSVESGKLMVAPASGGPGLLAGSVAVASGASLGGYGYIGSLAGAGTVAPGASIGTLHVTGAANLSALTLDTEIDAASVTADLLDVGGAASLAGGTLRVTNLGGTPIAGQSYTVLTAGTINGQFATVNFTQAYPGLSASVQYGTTSVRVVFSAAAGAGAGTHAIPTLSSTGLLLLGLGLGGLAWNQRRRRG